MENQTGFIPSSGPAPEPPKEPKETVREIHHHHYDRRGGFWRLFVGFFIIILGLALLAQNTGWFGSLDVWGFFARLWPVFIIIAGLSMLSRGGWVGGLITFAAVVLIGGLIAAAFLGAPEREGEVQTFDITRGEGAKVAEVSVSFGAGTFKMRGGSPSLASGRLESSFADLKTSSQVDGDTQYVSLETDSNFSGVYRKNQNELTVDLNNDIPTSIDIDSGASDLDIDLGTVNVTDFSIDTGASSLDLVLGDRAANASVSIDAGASSINITIPRGLGVKLSAEGALSSRNFQDFRSLGNGRYESENYAAAAKKVEINIDAGVSSLNVGWK
ncbi:MAG: hypothetical protein A2760_02690 [Candidatus Doudnabacteria bacterium RIFCSPHIGHO2_01_FULL_50_67]|nr:MAG: hypothetical protein A2760_02690 [Candidatus Doudnabacteria bacterium RIFCSPHIGHO2_01_FULL_50_67]